MKTTRKAIATESFRRGSLRVEKGDRFTVEFNVTSTTVCPNGLPQGLTGGLKYKLSRSVDPVVLTDEMGAKYSMKETPAWLRLID